MVRPRRPRQTQPTKPTTSAPVGTQTNAPAADTPPTAVISNQPPAAYRRGKQKQDKTAKADKTVQTKDTKKAIKKNTKADAIIGVDAKLPDKALYDKAYTAIQKGHYDIAAWTCKPCSTPTPIPSTRCAPSSPSRIAGTKKVVPPPLPRQKANTPTSASSFPNAPEAAEAQMRIGDIYFRQMDRPDRDYAKAVHCGRRVPPHVDRLS